LVKEKNDLEDMMSHLETEYRKANISEKSYSELKEKHSKRLEELNEKLGTNEIDESKNEGKRKTKENKKTKEEPKEELKIEEENPETLEEMNVEKKHEEKPKIGFLKKLFSGKKEHKEEKNEEIKKEKNVNEEKIEKTEEKPKVGIFGKLLGKKENSQEVKPKETDKKEEKSKEKKQIEVGEVEEMTPEIIEKLAQQVAEASGTTVTKTESEEVKEETSEQQTGSRNIEIEKMRVMIDAIREEKRAADDTIRNISESIGEIRSMVFQADTSLKETVLKFEKMEDEISEVKPNEIDKKIRGINERIEKHDISLEKIEKKLEDLAEKINRVHEMLKGIGNTENLMTLNRDIEEKLDDINEAVKYIERLGAKTEKIFVDLNQYLGDFVRYKSRQEDVEESMKDIIKSIDSINVKFEDYVNKKDLDTLKEDDMVLKKQMEEISKILPVVKVKLPDEVLNLRREKEDIQLLLDSMKEQLNARKISKGEYDKVKKSNEKKLKEIDRDMQKEWKKVENLFRLTEDLLKLTERDKHVSETKDEAKKEEVVETSSKV
jgi:hypothetical protein